MTTWYHEWRACVNESENRKKTDEATTVLKTWKANILTKHESSLPPNV